MTREYVLHPSSWTRKPQIDYAAELNEQQHAAVTAPPGPALVIAGAGSGKTRTLTYRVGFLLEQGIPPDRILLLTFTNKAAKEMMRRVASLADVDAMSLWGGTFHSVGNRILRQHSAYLGFEKDFTILDREDADYLIKQCLKEAEIKAEGDTFPKPKVLADIFSLAWNTRQTTTAVMETHYPYFMQFQDQIDSLQKRYAAAKRKANAMDFDDLLCLWLKLMEEHQEVREHYQRRFQFILVDEYQDTNKIQSDVIDLLAARHKNVMVVGDDAQSIYSWRGANFQNILKFPDRYPGAGIYKIETNYRSTPDILNVANAVIEGNKNQFAKTLVPVRKPGNKVAMVTCMSAREQAGFVAQRITQLQDEGVPMREMAVLYRSHFHALELQMELTTRGIPFSITSGIRFFEQAHIKDVAAYLRFVVNPRDGLALRRMVRLIPGVGERAAEKIWALFENLTLNWTPEMLETGAKAGEQDFLATTLQKCLPAVPKKCAVVWAQLTATISQLEEPSLRAKPAKLINLVLEAGYEDYLKEEYPNSASRIEDLRQLAIFATDFTSTDTFLSELALQTNLDAEPDSKHDEDADQVRLSTVHQAKGLEFDVTFVIMLNEKAFPSARTMDSLLAEDEEEERRLFYVAVTRARNELFLCRTLSRVNKEGDWETTIPSRFLNQIPRELLEEWNLVPGFARGM